MNIGPSLCLVGFLLSFSQIVTNCDAQYTPPKTYDTPLKGVIHSCRQKCISEVLGDSEWRGELMTYFRCRGTPNCFMCWDYCRAVSVARVDLAKSMCNDSQYCLKGCQVACNFYQTTTVYDVLKNLT